MQSICLKLSWVESIKNLGAILNWCSDVNEHIDQCTCVQAHCTYAVQELVLMEYCDVVYECTTEGDLHQLQLIQTSACRNHA